MKKAKVGDTVLIKSGDNAGERGEVIQVSESGFAKVELEGQHGDWVKLFAFEYIVANPSVPLHWSENLGRWVSVPGDDADRVSKVVLAYDAKLAQLETLHRDLGEFISEAKFASTAGRAWDGALSNWAHVGSLGHLEVLLGQAVDFARGTSMYENS